MKKGDDVQLRDMKGLGPKSEKDLYGIGITSVEDLKEIGPIPAYLRLKAVNGKVSLNMLYALVGAVEGRHWLDVAQQDRSALLTALEAYCELEQILSDDGVPL